MATKRALRALLKALDVAAKDPERGARTMMDPGFVNETLHEATSAELPTIRHDVWRMYDSADTLRFWALRMREGSLIKSTPEQIVTRGADFRSLEELKRELKES